jgi:hypothetical protein
VRGGSDVTRYVSFEAGNADGLLDGNVLACEFAYKHSFFLSLTSCLHGSSESDDEGILSWLAGLKDLKAGVIRTPLPSKETFLDDPLRVMRAVRFGGCL